MDPPRMKTYLRAEKTINLLLSRARAAIQAWRTGRKDTTHFEHFARCFKHELDIGLEFMCSLMTLVSHKNFVMYVNLRNTVVNEPREIVEAHWRNVNIRTSEVDATRILPVYHGDWWSDVEVAPVRWSWVTALRIFSLELKRPLHETRLDVYGIDYRRIHATIEYLEMERQRIVDAGEDPSTVAERVDDGIAGGNS